MEKVLNDRKAKSLQKECQIAEIVQHACTLVDDGGNPKIHCFPIPRLFKLCPGQPAFEITKFVKIDPQNGEVDISPDFSVDSIKARSWREIVRYDESSGMTRMRPSEGCPS